MKPPDFVIGATMGVAKKACIDNGWPVKIARSVRSAGRTMKDAKGTFVEVLGPGFNRGSEEWVRTRNVGLTKQQLEFWDGDLNHG